MTIDVSAKADARHQHELSPLLISDSLAGGDDHDIHNINSNSNISSNSTGTEQHGSASFPETVTNLTKACMGTGCLALPYAARQGGLLLYVVGLFAIALWNLYATIRLCHSWELLSGAHTLLVVKEHEQHSHGHGRRTAKTPFRSIPPPPEGTATLGKLAWYALGPRGLYLLDVLTVLLLMGIIVAYYDAIRAFLHGTPCTTGSDVFDAIINALVIAPLTLVKDMGYLTKTSAAGLSVLTMTLLVIAGYGWQNYEHNSFASIRWLPLNGLAGVSNWFGCTVFGFGIVALTFNFRDSMQDPPKYPKAATTALLMVAVLYNVIGLVLLIFYPGIEGDVLSEIPQEGILPIFTRLAMVVVIVSTTPLLVVPCAELIEGKLRDDGSSNNTTTKTIVRFGICLVTVAISVGIPEFVSVLTLVGSFCVAFVSFCIPPFLYVMLRTKQGTPLSSLAFDILMLLWGLTATFISTTYIFTRLVAK